MNRKKTKIKKVFFKTIRGKQSDVKNTGITLISLVITIVVLIILAGVIISITIGNGGIIDRARKAKQEYANAKGYEELQVAKTANEIDGFVGGSSREGTPVTLDGQEHEIGTFNGEKLYQKTFVNREVTVTSTARTWYTVVSNSELNSLNVKDVWIDEGNSFIQWKYVQNSVNKSRNFCFKLL